MIYMSVWTMDISSIVFSRIVANFSEDLKIKYKMQKLTAGGLTTWRNFSTSQVSEAPPIFPYITIIELPGQEKGQDLEGSSINAVFFTFQVDVFDNKNESRARECMKEIVRIMKTMRFQIPTTASFNSKPQEYRMVARFSRLIGHDDNL